MSDEYIESLIEELNDAKDAFDQAQAQLAALRLERDEAVYIPGSWACTQCEFETVITNLYVKSGTIGPNTDEVPICPNDGSLMRRCTWKERVMDFDKALTAALNDRNRLRPTWTSERPKEPGWYWWKHPGTFPRCVLLQEGKEGLFGANNVYIWSKTWNGQWCGPLPLPSEG